MMHWWASKSDGYSSASSTVAPSPCDAVQSCPGSGGFSGPLGTFCVAVSERPRIPDVFCVCGHSRTTSSCAHRRRPANAEHREFGCKLLAASWDDGCGTSFDRPEVESPKGQTRRKKWWGHCWPAGLHSVELLFFRLKLGIVTLFPGLRAAKLDLLFMQKRPESFNANGGNHLLLKKIFSQLF